jgi:hypothetical protein
MALRLVVLVGRNREFNKYLVDRVAPRRARDNHNRVNIYDDLFDDLFQHDHAAAPSHGTSGRNSRTYDNLLRDNCSYHGTTDYLASRDDRSSDDYSCRYYYVGADHYRSFP